MLITPRLYSSVACIGLTVLMSVNCGTDPRKSTEYKALNRSRAEVIAAAVKIRSDSRPSSQPSENFSGNYALCQAKGSVHYSLGTDWITPKGDEDDLRTFDYVVRTLEAAGWKDAGTPSRRERKMRRGELAIGVSIKPGAAWISGDIGGPCYKVADAAGDFLNRGIDHLS
jgi:hypothetical protein